VANVATATVELQWPNTKSRELVVKGGISPNQSMLQYCWANHFWELKATRSTKYLVLLEIAQGKKGIKIEDSPASDSGTSFASSFGTFLFRSLNEKI